LNPRIIKVMAITVNAPTFVSFDIRICLNKLYCKIS